MTEEPLRKPTVTIKTVKQNFIHPSPYDAWKAYVVEEPGDWSNGRSEAEAVGRLIFTSRHKYNIEWDREPDEFGKAENSTRRNHE